MEVNDSSVPQIGQLVSVFNNVVGAALSFSAVILLVLLASAGIQYMTSGGDPKATEVAQKRITYAFGGLILLLVSYLILVLIENITGAPVTKFNILLDGGGGNFTPKTRP